jgi:hypothetical protein
MKRTLSYVSSLAVLLASASFAHAGIFTSLPVTDLPSSNYISVLGNPPTTASLDTVLPSASSSYTVSGTTQGDPILDITEKATNTTGTPWVSYEIDINPTPGSSIVFGSISVDTTSGFAMYPNMATDLPTVNIDQTNHIVTFSGGVVPAGQSVSAWIEFDVTGDAMGNYGYQIYNFPSSSGSAPEPASLALLAPAAMFFLRRRRA